MYLRDAETETEGDRVRGPTEKKREKDRQGWKGAVRKEKKKKKDRRVDVSRFGLAVRR